MVIKWNLLYLSVEKLFSCISRVWTDAVINSQSKNLNKEIVNSIFIYIIPIKIIEV